MKIQFNGVELEVEGTYHPFRPGRGVADYYGPTPDEPEDFEISDLKYKGTDVFELLDGLYGPAGLDVIETIVKMCILESRNA